jgi:hypothetical protein
MNGVIQSKSVVSYVFKLEYFCSGVFHHYFMVYLNCEGLVFNGHGESCMDAIKYSTHSKITMGLVILFSHIMC